MAAIGTGKLGGIDMDDFVLSPLARCARTGGIPAMDGLTPIHAAALRHAPLADRDDARVWRWTAEAVDEGRLACRFQRGFWHIVLDGRLLAIDPSFDCAMRLVRAIDGAAAHQPGGARSS